MTAIKLSLPIPPSVNEAYAGYPKRHKSNKYKRWEKEIERLMKDELVWTISWDEWLEVTYIFYLSLHFKNGNKRVQDVTNYEKCLTDCLTHHINGFKDHKIKKITMEKKEWLWIVDIEIKELSI